MKTIDYFQVYNRWGGLIYRHNLNDGQAGMERLKVLNKTQDTFIWMVRATDIMESSFQKGNCIAYQVTRSNDFLKTSFMRGFFFLYNNFIVQHSFINQGLLTDR
jgi:hypothetical protein